MYVRTQVESPETYRHPVTKKIFFLAQHTDVLRIYETEQKAAATSGWSHYVDNNHKNILKKVHQNAYTG